MDQQDAIVFDDDSSTADNMEGIMRHHIFFIILHPFVQTDICTFAMMKFEPFLIDQSTDELQIICGQMHPNRRGLWVAIALQKFPDVILKMTIIDSHYRSEMDSFVGVRSDVKLGMEGTGSGEVESCRYLSDHDIISFKALTI